jgi:hypothetical protein
MNLRIDDQPLARGLRERGQSLRRQRNAGSGRADQKSAT